MDQNQCIQFIELYRNYPVLWNPKLIDYHNRNKKEDALKDISAEMDIPVHILKPKMKSLMGTYRSERSRENKKTTGSGTDSIYVSKWFAYKYFDFQSDKDTPRETINSLNQTLDLINKVSHYLDFPQMVSLCNHSTQMLCHPISYMVLVQHMEFVKHMDWEYLTRHNSHCF
ncbi:hypothetical protein QTP88_001343 [Uroleucon formosanum]